MHLYILLTLRSNSTKAVSEQSCDVITPSRVTPSRVALGRVTLSRVTRSDWKW